MKQRLLFLSLVMMLLGVGVDGWGQTTETYAMSSMDLPNATAVGTSVRNTTDDKITFTFAQNSSTTAPAYYTYGTAVRLYQHETKGGSIKIMVASGYKITSATVSKASGDGDGPVGYAVDGGSEVGSFADGTITNTTGAINATSSVEFYSKGNSSSTRFYVVSFSVTYTSGATTYTVTYDGNGSTGGTAPSDPNSPYASGATVTVLGNTGSLVKTGFTFNNWNTAANGSGTPYAPAATFTIAANTILYAQWVVPEPTNHVSGFSATANSSSQITVNWTDATGGQIPAGYLIKAAIDPSSPTAPSDGTAEPEGTLVKNIAQGTGTAVFTGLTASTTYNFAIWPYTNSGINIDYKIGSQPTASIATQEIASIKWDGGASTTAWADANNWSGNVVPTSTDNVLLDNSLVSGSYSVVLPSGNVKTTINKLTITPTLPNIITLTLPTENTYGASNDAGFVVGDNTASTDDIIINEGGVLVNSSGGSSGNGVQVNALANGTCRLNNGGKFTHNTSRSTAGIVPLLSTEIGTEEGIFEYDVAGTGSATISASGRTYGSLTLTRTAGAATYTSTGGTALTIKGNLLINAGVTYTTTMTGAMNIAGDFINNGTALTIAATQAIVFNGTSPQIISGSNNITFSGAVTINSGASVNIAQNIGVTISGTLTNSGTLTIKSDASGTGSLIHSTAGVAATVERYIASHGSVATDGWHLIGSPVATFNIDGSSFDPGANDDIYAWNEATNTWLNHKAGDPTQIVAGTGYIVAYENTGAKNFSGNLNVANVSVSGLAHTAAQGKGWHLLGNPFASALEWNKTGGSWALTNVAGTAKVWNSTTKAYVDLSANGIIPAAQGFFVQVNEGTTGSLTIPAAARAHSSTAWYKNTAPRLILSASPIDGSSSQESQILIENEATNNFDFFYDARFLAGYAPQFYSLCGEEKLSTNVLSEAQNESSVPFGFVKNQNENFVIRLEENNLGQNVYLKDLKHNLTHNLSQETEYYFSSTDGDNPNRFLLHFGAVGISEQPTSATLKAYVVGAQLYFPLQGEATLEIVDLQGRVLQQSKVIGQGLASQPLQLTAGAYVVRLTTGHSVQTAKVIVK